LSRLHGGVDWDGKDFAADNVKALLAQSADRGHGAQQVRDRGEEGQGVSEGAADGDGGDRQGRQGIPRPMSTPSSPRASPPPPRPPRGGAKAREAPASGGSGASAKASSWCAASSSARFAQLRKPAQPGQVQRPMRFIVVQGKTGPDPVCSASRVGPAQVKLLTTMNGGDAPFQDPQVPGVVGRLGEERAHLRQRPLNGSVLKKVQLWLKKTFKLNVKLRLRNSKGVSRRRGRGLSDDMLKLEADDALSAEDAAQEYQDRLGALAEAIRKAMTSRWARRSRRWMASSSQNAKNNKFDSALAELDEIEACSRTPAGRGVEGEESEAEEEPTASSAAAAGKNRRPDRRGEEARAREADDRMEDASPRGRVSLKDVAGMIAAAKHAS
jgi:hypothetical protein